MFVVFGTGAAKPTLLRPLTSTPNLFTQLCLLFSFPMPATKFFWLQAKPLDSSLTSEIPGPSSVENGLALSFSSRGGALSFLVFGGRHPLFGSSLTPKISAIWLSTVPGRSATFEKRTYSSFLISLWVFVSWLTSQQIVSSSHTNNSLIDTLKRSELLYIFYEAAVFHIREPTEYLVDDQLDITM